MVRFALLLVFCLGFCSSADAQLLRWKRSAMVSSSCPNGQCPAQVVQSAPEVRGHWSYPGTIDNHLESTHGVSTAGMTRQQKLDLHDSLHEGTGSFATVSRYKASYGSTGSKATYGSSGGSGVYRLSTVGQTGDVSSLGIRKRKASREAILEAANKAHADCTINSDELRAIKLACMSPRMLSKIEDLIIEKAQNSGAYSFALKSNGEVDKAAIDWEAIGDFILKIAPIIFKLIELFAILENASPSQTAMAFYYDQPLNFTSTLAITGC